MKYILCIATILLGLWLPVSAAGIVAPEVPDDIENLMPAEDDAFGPQLWQLMKEAWNRTQPAVASGVKLCISILACVILFSVLQNLNGRSKAFAEFAAALAVSGMMIGNANSMIEMGVETVQEISQYGKLLLPVMTAALASQGGSISAASLYGATAIFDTVLTSIISSVMVPMIYVFLIFSIVRAVTGEDILQKIRDMIKQIMSWFLKLALYIFTGYISITGVISGTADQAAVKATKLTISGMVPIVGGIMSDASETILISAGVIKNSAGIYGLIAILAVGIVPFMTIGIHYLMVKMTAAICAVFTSKNVSNLLDDFASAMGLILGIFGAVGLIQLISIVCFLRGMG
jgi:stage III sporulation protein AE